MKTPIIFEPLPFAQCASFDVEQYNAVFLNNSSSVISLSRQTKAFNSNVYNFQDYLTILYQYVDAPFRSAWKNPFKPDEVMTGNKIEFEIINTLWNYLATLHGCIFQLNSANSSDLKLMKQYIADSKGCVNKMIEIVSRIDNYVYNDLLIQFLFGYNEYISSCWNYSIVMIGAKKSDLFPKAASLCLSQITKCVEYAKLIPNPNIQSYLLTISKAIQNYFHANARFLMAINSISQQEYGMAIAYLNDALNVASRNENFTFSFSLNNSIQLLKQQIEAQNKNAILQNRNIYNQSVPSLLPKIPEPIPLTQIEANQNLIQTACPNDNVANYDNTQTNSISGPPPNFNQPPQFRPQAPEIFNQQSTNETNEPIPTENGDFPEWDAICILKTQITKKLSDLCNSNNPTFRNISNELQNQLKKGISGDNIINSFIQQYKEHKVDKASVDKLIVEASQFYTSVEHRINQLQLTG